jgi:hypothetical protein
MKKLLMVLASAALFTTLVAPAASAQVWSTRPVDKTMFLTFSGPVSLPNVTLPAGTYLFRFVDPMNAPGVLWVMSQDGRTPYAMLNTIPIVRTESESNNSEIVTFHETPVNEPAAIDAWWFNAPETLPGYQDTGCEVLYNK